MKFLVIFIFVVICLVQFCVIVIRNGMFYWKNKIIKFSYHFLLCSRYRVYLLMKKKLINFWPILVILYVKSIIFFTCKVFARGCSTLQWSDLPVHLDNFNGWGVHSHATRCWEGIITYKHLWMIHFKWLQPNYFGASKIEYDFKSTIIIIIIINLYISSILGISCWMNER